MEKEAQGLIATLDTTFFQSNCETLSVIKEDNDELNVFKADPQFDSLLDCLQRKNRHHVLLQNANRYAYKYFLTAFLSYLQNDITNPNLCALEIIIFKEAIAGTPFTKPQQAAIKKAFLALLTELDSHGLPRIFCIPSNCLFPTTEAELFMSQQLQTLANHLQCRLICCDFDDKSFSPQNSEFSVIELAKVSYQDEIKLLINCKKDLENYHRITLNNEIVELAYNLSARFLSASQPLETALLLVDSCAARSANANVKMDEENAPAPNTSAIKIILYNLLMHQTQIPISKLQTSQLSAMDIASGLQKLVHGQDTAIHLISEYLQQAQIRFAKSEVLFGSFLFVGPSNSSKKTLTRAIAKQLYGRSHCAYFSHSLKSTNSVLEIKFSQSNHLKTFTLADIIHKTPYAILFFDTIEEGSENLLTEINFILEHGYCEDKLNNSNSTLIFKNTIFILGTSIGDEKINEIAHTLSARKSSSHTDLLQLVMSENTEFSSQTPEEIARIIYSEIIGCQKIAPSLHLTPCLIPCFPLNLFAAEKIIKQSMRDLTHRLDKELGLEFSFEPEVIKYLRDKAQLSEDVIDIKRGLQVLYKTIDQAILQTHKSQHLYLHLNETGDNLRYDWLALSAVRVGNRSD